jgi:hypothetical protein
MHEELNMRPRVRKLILFAPLGIVGLGLLVAVGGEIVMQLWNWLLPSIFGWRQITFWQALGVLALCRILFGGFGGHGSRGSGVHRRGADRLADRVDERCQHMTPEERERFRQRMRERFGFGPATAGEGKQQ